jgi:hypothetical protein
MFQIIDFSLNDFSTTNNFIIHHYIYENKIKYIMPQKIRVSDYKNINNIIYYDLNCFIVSLNDIFNFEKKIFIDTHKNLYIELYNYIINKDIDIFCEKVLKKKIKNVYIKNLL